MRLLINSDQDEVIRTTKELVIPTDDPNVMKAFDPYSIQGMLNALTFFAREHGKDVTAVDDIRGRSYVMDMGNVKIIMAPTESGRAVKHVVVISKSHPVTTTLGIFNPDKVEYDEEEPIKFYARDPSAVLTIDTSNGSAEADLKVTDMRHPDRVHGGTINYTG